MNALVFKLLAQRIALALVSLLVVSVIVFAITAVLPGDAAQEQLGQDATPAVLVFAVELRWLPALSYVADIESLGQMLRAFAMPVLTLCCVIVAQMMRMTRAAVVDQLEAPYIEMVRLKGASPLRIVLAHALPNAVGPIANAVALSLSYLLGGVIIVEVIFNYPGIAKLMVDAVAQRDMPLVQACAMIFCAAYLILVTLADVS